MRKEINRSVKPQSHWVVEADLDHEEASPHSVQEVVQSCFRDMEVGPSMTTVVEVEVGILEEAAIQSKAHYSAD